MIDPTIAEQEWHQVLADRTKANQPRLGIGDLVAALVLAVGAFAFARPRTLASGAYAIAFGAGIAASRVAVASLAALCLSGPIVLGRASSALHRRADGRSGVASLALRVASVLAEFGAFALLVLIGIQLLIGVVCIAAVVIGITMGMTSID